MRNHDELNPASAQDEPFWSLLIPLIASGISSLIGAKVSSKAAKGAAATQVQASNQALQYAQQAYAQQQQLLAPYLGLGSQALSAIGRVNSPPAGLPRPMVAPAAPFTGTPGSPMMQAGGPTTVGMPVLRPTQPVPFSAYQR